MGYNYDDDSEQEQQKQKRRNALDSQRNLSNQIKNRKRNQEDNAKNQTHSLGNSGANHNNGSFTQGGSSGNNASVKTTGSGATGSSSEEIAGSSAAEGAGFTGTAAGSTAAGSASAAGSVGGASGGAAAGSTAAGSAAGGAAAGGAAVGGGVVFGVILGVIIFIFVIIFIVAIIEYLTEQGVQQIASGWFVTQKAKIEVEEDSLYAKIKDFFGADGTPFKMDTTAEIEVDESMYDKDNEFDIGYIEMYKTCKLALRNAYNMCVEDQIDADCKENGWDSGDTIDALNNKYPNGYEDVYADINYADLMNIFDFGFDSGFFTLSDGLDSRFKPEIMQNKFTNEYSYYPYFFTITYEETEETVVDEITKKEKMVTHIIPTVQPYCYNDLFEMIGIDPNSSIPNDGNITYKDKMDAMLQQAKANCSDQYDEPRTIYQTLQLESTEISWNSEFSSDTIETLVSNSVVVSANGSVQNTVHDTLKAAGFTEEAIAGVMGNLQAENSFRTNWVPGDQGSHGICQWRGGRKTAFEAYADQRGLAYDTAEAQVGYLLYEMPSSSGMGAQRYETLKSCTDIDQACALFAQYFERCASFYSKSAWDNKSASYRTSYKWNRFGYSKAGNRYFIDYATRYGASIKFYNSYNKG